MPAKVFINDSDDVSRYVLSILQKAGLGKGFLSCYPGCSFRSICQNNQNGLSFTDYKHAHSNNNLINVGNIKRKNYKNIKDIQYKRKNQNLKLTKKQQEKLLKLDKQKQLQEQERIIRVKNRDKNISKHFHKTNHLMINFRN